MQTAKIVAPFTGAWIEMLTRWVCPRDVSVAPFTGAWIEIYTGTMRHRYPHSRSLHGSVD